MRNDDNSDACDETPRAEEECYARGRFQDEFRIKPAPSMKLVRMYKNPYDGKYSVWRLTDCIPTRARCPQTEGQWQASARLSLLARMKNERDRSTMLARTWLTPSPVFLDTETTGPDVGTQALEINLVNVRGRRIFEARLRPTIAIDSATIAVHSISDEDLVRTPSWPGIARQLQHRINRHPLVIFNTKFGTRILKQTVAAYNDLTSWLNSLTVYCAMWLTAGYYRSTNRYDTISLSGVTNQTGLRWIGGAHSTVADAVMTVRMVNNTTGHWRGLQREMNDDAGSETA